MQFGFIFSLLFAIFVAVFAVMNSDVVTIQFLWKEYQLSQSVVILISATFGALVTFFISLFSKMKYGMKSRENKNKISGLEKNIKGLEEANKNYEIEIERLKLKLEHAKTQQMAPVNISKDENTKKEDL
ncbi:Protein of unknown function [Peptoclostridium litorale DSM 5388]|uniref:Lipopolysaccharide assembly protein A domain-containing protein n=1 Tax=Peptoclostridium litorale DSM 5388 TaxID=1121324 RepID=A0A069RI85_PEPLI|nr:LapA family protein [Peptoclostridium litorale]KDR93962.1 hypothetical protein CLIT_23c02340 [Peptoclostridium litorale DSM 5388]KDR95389.1 hypothetical protein CLIT_10c01160 [Peptoclostridium litorale DSM 5388]SIN89401.1 Protein of unknown function [Peptoclostridium litorale DSM 5388]